ncbi:aldo/keto reductase [Polymorphospora rubra]|uniref:Oxidoreductase n=1 Tax=Polymorphospora rubra TaxID=338584 RepID=A0A810N2V5_9ACTN|nr:aldo/keto reductase [Polymorphospora rubra]BCJ67677.1 oxidoreductase [Polymorphospora rubra]
MTQTTQRAINLPSGDVIPVVGLGTWGMAEDVRRRDEEIAALRLGLDLGMHMIDTAETYADGAAERLVGEVIRGRRDEVFIVDKVSPTNASATGAVNACERSLRRLGTDRIDLFLLHWRGSVPLEETITAMTTLVTEGRIRHWGVSNFDLPDLVELTSLPGGTAVEANQVLYNLGNRGIEWELLPRCREAGLPVMAYSPLGRGRVLGDPALREVAIRHDAKPAQVALAWTLRQEGVCAIPKASTPGHIQDLWGAFDLRLSGDDLTMLDRAFPPPNGQTTLEML